MKRMIRIMCKAFLCFVVLSVSTISGFGFTLEPTGLAKPIADLRDYNGTYEGSIGTGRFGYGGTLYRDNQDNGLVSGCRGEGCGKHPGVDIPVVSGTNVYNAIGGTVVISECNESWGGLIVVRATNPWNYGEQIYVTYAHLKSRRYWTGALVQVGDYITTGTKIGNSGGGTKDSCAGRSTGPHLHFQIDKDDGNVYPWYPSLSQLQKPDSNFEVIAKTYNPIVFITGGYRWTFASNKNRELWDLISFQTWGVSDGAVWLDGLRDPYIRRGGLTNCGQSRQCSSALSVEASEYGSVYVDTYNECLSGAGKVYFITNTDGIWNESKSVSYYPWYGSYQTHVNMSQNYFWKGVITGLRIDPAEHCNRFTWDPTYFGEITIER